MPGPQNKNFNLPWHQYDQYWVTVGMSGAGFPPSLAQALKGAGMESNGRVMSAKTDRNWSARWAAIYTQLQQANVLESVEAAVTSTPVAADGQGVDWRPAAAVQQVAESMWLGDALLEDRILCYLQPVVSGRDKVFGYESFARVRLPDDTIIGGDKIISASRALNIEFMIDRHLHVQAITTFVCSDFDGFLFVNLFPGFIQRPSVYLEGLSEAAKNFGIVSKHIVLDFTRSETPRDIARLKSICEYGRSCGYSIALDDIESLDGAKKLVPDIKPDFVKLDMKLARKAEDASKREIIARIVDLAHTSGGTVIAEGVETEAMHQALKALNVDLFQGYYFSPPVPVEAVVKRSAGTA